MSDLQPNWLIVVRFCAPPLSYFVIAVIRDVAAVVARHVEGGGRHVIEQMNVARRLARTVIEWRKTLRDHCVEPVCQTGAAVGCFQGLAANLMPSLGR